jgi:hypothetical protein
MTTATMVPLKKELSLQNDLDNLSAVLWNDPNVDGSLTMIEVNGVFART